MRAFSQGTRSITTADLTPVINNEGNANKFLTPEGVKEALAQFNVDYVDTFAPVDHALVSQVQKGDPLGGIDFNAANLKLQIKRDGKGIPLPIGQQQLEQIKIDGLIPVILYIKPAIATPLLSELRTSKVQQKAKI